MGAVAHTHDDVDWAERLPALRRADELDAEALAEAAARLTGGLPAGATVVDVGSGAGGMSAALATVLSKQAGGRLVLVDAVPELLAAATETATAAVSGVSDGQAVRIETVHADAAAEDLPEHVPPADLVWASGLVHHLPDQQAAVATLTGMLRRAGILALGEGGLDTRCLPWDLGVGEPGLEQRLLAGRARWFLDMRTAMPGSVRMPYGWSEALNRAGLIDVGSFSTLIDHPAPASAALRAYVVGQIEWLADTAADHLGEDDRNVVRRLLDPDAAEFLGNRDDLYLLTSHTIHYGRKP
ncbi:class I SAM-dependent methyltransferase [Amycolatopsis anabasis]|uniref:class I SAM-dependent methyltransferase n=1 Tax=Amycolatopsis anabasis TaxID=1840409 RepID=UPI00131B0B28|nr:methyltransferase domain-containing protein [Amycolatopsis anabasis]